MARSGHVWWPDSSAAACTPPTNNTASLTPASTPTSSPTTAPSPSPSPSPSAEPTAPALTITSMPVHNGEVGIGYLAVTLHATGGTTPYTWSVSGGTFPPGLSLSSAGVITGKNTTAGKFLFTVKVKDSADQTDTSSTTIGVFTALAATQPCSTVCNVGADCTQCGAFGGASGDLGPYQYKITGGAVPTGMTWSGLKLVGPFPMPPVTAPAYAINPVLAAPQRWTLTVQVSDVFGATRSVKANWQVFDPIAWYFSSPDISPYIGCYSGATAGSCTNSDQLYVLGSPADSVTVKVVQACYDDAQAQYLCTTDPTQFATYLPPNWTASANNGVLTVGMDCAQTCTNWYGDVYIVLVDNGKCVAPSHRTTLIQMDVNIDI